MRKYIERAINKFDKLDKDQILIILESLVSDNEIMEMVLESMRDGIIVCDVQHRIILLNKAADRLLPIASGDLREKEIWSVILDEDIKNFFYNALQDQDKVEDREFTLDYSDSNRTLLFSILPLVKEGTIQGSLIHIVDVTERRSREARLRRAENLASLTTLAAGVAHEIKNPLGSVSIHIQLIQKLLDKNCNEVETVKHYLEIISEEVQRLNGIVVDFLFAVRPMHIQFQRDNINNLIHEIIEFVHFELDDHNVKYLDKTDPNLPKSDFDSKYMKQAFLNIIKNAIAAMPDGGNLSISTEMEGKWILIQFKDSGYGISEENLSKIFEPYFTTKDFGSGLGLTLVYKIIREHGGEMAVQSKEGSGSTFTISLPAPGENLKLINYQESL